MRLPDLPAFFRSIRGLLHGIRRNQYNRTGTWIGAVSASRIRPVPGIHCHHNLSMGDRFFPVRAILFFFPLHRSDFQRIHGAGIHLRMPCMALLPANPTDMLFSVFLHFLRRTDASTAVWNIPSPLNGSHWSLRYWMSAIIPEYCVTLCMLQRHVLLHG